MTVDLIGKGLSLETSISKLSGIYTRICDTLILELSRFRKTLAICCGNWGVGKIPT